MHNITARNVNTALCNGLWWLKVVGIKESSRNGPVLVSPDPVVTTYLAPCERVLFSAARDANPFFHLFEALWMLAGRRDLEWPLFFNSKFGQFSDDGKTLHGAYGYRWRNWGSEQWDQLIPLIKLLKEEPDTRRAVLSMWNPDIDLWAPSSGVTPRDLPCNTTIYFDRRNSKLNMTVCCRSNDLVYGCAGANVVHFSMLQEYVAAHIGVSVGVYRQFSNNFHVYLDLPGYPSIDPNAIGEDDRYSEGTVQPFPLVRVPATFDVELLRFMSDPLGDAAYEEPFFDVVAAPMYAAWHDRKSKHSDGRLSALAIRATDWRAATLDWIARRTLAV